jgi:hypothetical protein
MVPNGQSPRSLTLPTGSIPLIGDGAEGGDGSWRGACVELRCAADAVAARAGTCRTTVKNALREARRLGLVTVQERRRRGQKSLTNLVRIVSPGWTAWIRIGGKKSTTTDTSQKDPERKHGFGGNWERYRRHYDPERKRCGRA